MRDGRSSYECARFSFGGVLPKLLGLVGIPPQCPSFDSTKTLSIFLLLRIQVPGSLRLTSLVGVGGWKDTELAVTCKEANACMLESQGEEASLTKLVEDLYQRITTLNNGEDSQA